MLHLAINLIAAASLLVSSNVPAKTVDAFYSWYVARHGHVEKDWSAARSLFEEQLFDLVDETYFKDTGGHGPIWVSPCPDSASQRKLVPYDPFSNATAPAESYSIGATRVDGSEAAVEVMLRLSGKASGTSRVTAKLHRNDDGKYAIDDLLFEHSGYYYAGPIADLKKFLGDYNC